MPSVPLPTSLAAAIPSIRWPLGPSSCPPLYFESLEQMKEIRSKSCAEGSGLALNLVDTLSDTIASNDVERDFLFVSVALILLGNGYTDEAHDIVTPLSWPEDTHFGYGPSVYSRVDDRPKAFATHVHSLVHRREGFNVGEFGMMGFANANYWSNAAMKKSSCDLLPHSDLYKHVIRVGESYNHVKSIQDWYRRHGLSADSWESRAVHELCAQVLRDDQDKELVEFAEKVAETELRVLLGHALQNAGYDCTLETVLSRDAAAVGKSITTTSQDDDTTSGLVAANKVSFAHLQAFQTHKCVTLRNMTDGTRAELVAAGIATRLLGVPACRRAVEKEDFVVCIALPTNQEEAQAVNMRKTGNSSSSSGGPLSPGDVEAVLTNECVGNDGAGPLYTFVPCDVNDSRAVFVDTLYDARGETPTSVVQWSKGTIF